MKPATAGVFTPWVLADAAVGRLSNLCWPPPSSPPSSTSSSPFLGYADPQGLKHRQALSPGISSGSPRPRVGAPQAVLLKARPVAGAVKSPSSNFTLKKTEYLQSYNLAKEAASRWQSWLDSLTEQIKDTAFRPTAPAAVCLPARGRAGVPCHRRNLWLWPFPLTETPKASSHRRPERCVCGGVSPPSAGTVAPVAFH